MSVQTVTLIGQFVTWEKISNARKGCEVQNILINKGCLQGVKIIKFACEQNNVEEYIIGMAHRGRLNVLTKIMQKPYMAVLSEFQGNITQIVNLAYSGDVKYHLGKSSDIEFANGKKIHLSLTPNLEEPSLRMVPSI